MVMSGKKVSLVEVAARAGVSIATASIALHGESDKGGRVGVATREKVRQAADALRYVPNNAARNLASRKSGFIGYLLSDDMPEGLENSLSGRYLSGVEAACRERGYGLYVARATLSDIQKVVFPEKLRQQSVDGLVAFGPISDEVFQEFERYQLPTVFLNRNRHTENKYATFCVDLFHGYRLAVERAYELGHRRAWLCRLFGAETAGASRELVAELSARHPGLDVRLTDFLREPYEVERHADELFTAWRADPERPTFLAGDSRILARLLAKTQGAGVRCPEDLSLMAVGDFEFNRYVHPQLSCADFDMERVAFDAAELVIEHAVSGEPIPLDSSNNDYPAHLIERESTRRLAP